METTRTDNLGKLREKIFGSTKPKSLNGAIEELPPEQRQVLENQVKLQNLGMQYIRGYQPYYSYKELIKERYNFDSTFGDLLVAVLESLDPTPEMPIEERNKKMLDKKSKSNGSSIYGNPKFFPPRDTNNGGPNPRASKGGRVTAQQIEAPSATISSEETLFDFDNTALLNPNNTTEGTDAANKTLRNKLEASESSGRTDAEITLDDIFWLFATSLCCPPQGLPTIFTSAH